MVIKHNLQQNMTVTCEKPAGGILYCYEWGCSDRVMAI